MALSRSIALLTLRLVGANEAEFSVLESLSGISGSISLVSWIVLLLPQLIENYKNGCADALSLAFLIAWFVGDLANLIGAVWGGLLPTVIAIAIYFTFADAVLLLQAIYYNHVQHRSALTGGRRNSYENGNDPTQSLLNRRRSSGGLSQHRRNSARRRDSLSAVLRSDSTQYEAAVRNSLAIFGVCTAGTLGWLFAWWTGAWKVQNDSPLEIVMPLGAEVLGYISAALYLVARIPQILHNYRKKSCEGLSYLFFCLSFLGNISYGAGILFHSREKSYIVDNLPWLMGSLGTIVEDAIVFVQFHIYSRPPADDEYATAEEVNSSYTTV